MSAAVAIVDGGSFVLPYDYQLVKALAGRGATVHFYGSRTRYNGEFLDAMRELPGVSVIAHGVSGTVSPRWRGLLAYAGLLARLAWRSRRCTTVNLQFSVWWPLEIAVWLLLRRKLLFTVHNAVPHGFEGEQHAPTRRIASLAGGLVFPSEATRDDFLRRYGKRYAAKSTVLSHGLLPVAPGLEPVAYTSLPAPRTLVFWSTVKPYKGVELFAELARSPRIRARGLALRVAGRWDRALHPLRDELVALGVQVDDRFLDRTELLRLLAEPDALFVMPYREASQSGAMYSLLHHGRAFICADVGDPGAFMRACGLEALLLRERSADAVADCLDRLDGERDVIAVRLRAAQAGRRWDTLLAAAGGAYGLT